MNEAKTEFVIPAEAGIQKWAEGLDPGERRGDGHVVFVIPAFAGVQYSLPMPKQPCVYIMASRKNGTLYVGVTSDLLKRVWEHKNDVVPGFTQRYRLHTLVWFELHATMATAIAREKAIKEWKRQWKLELIEQMNAKWRDLYPDLC